MKGIVLTHPTGNEFFRAAAKGFYEAGQLQSLYTSLASFPNTFLYGLGGLPMLSDIRRRAISRELKQYTHTYPWRETGRLIAIKAGRQKLTAHEKGVFSIDSVYRSLDCYVAGRLQQEKAKGAGAIYAYEDGAAFSFKKGKEFQLECVYDLPIGYWRSMHNMLLEEAGKTPDWAATLGGLNDSTEKLKRKDDEISLADKIIVASSFTASTLKEYPGKLPPVHVVPYGFPIAEPKEYGVLKKGQPLKILFVGGLSQRKGLSYLFDAVNKLGNYVSLTVVGRGTESVNNCKPLQENLNQHRWIETIPHDEVLALMREHDVLVFPSLFEGFGLVITEAMSQGTPVITTERTAGSDLINHGENGWLVNAGCADAISHILEQILSRPQSIAEVGTAAVGTAGKRPWSVYGRELAGVVGKSESQ
ncbi:MAG TPA: glycosyltransferase family 4 protein [Parafilimonas sp.]|nr:glycosyltransferase family 4 protein [Parafilimonas sp.]